MKKVSTISIIVLCLIIAIRFGINYYKNNIVYERFDNEFNIAFDDVLLSIENEDDYKKVIDILSSSASIEKIHKLNLLIEEYETRLNPDFMKWHISMYSDLKKLADAKGKINDLSEDETRDIKTDIFSIRMLWKVNKSNE